MKFDGYKVNRKHRTQRAAATCTQWVVSEWEEIQLFSTAKLNEWICPKECLWAIRKINDKLSVLGKTDKKSAFIAKYVSNNNNEWHGYPVTPSRDADRPPSEVLDAWREAGIINKSTQAKIVKGKF